MKIPLHITVDLTYAAVELLNKKGPGLNLMAN